MLSERRIGRSRGEIIGGVVGLFVVCQAPPALAAAPASGVLLDFKDDTEFAQIRVGARAKIEPASESCQGKRAAKIEFAPVPEALRDYPAVVIEDRALKVRDFTSFEAISLWVKNPGPDDAELSLSVWDKDGNRSFPIPSTVAIKPGRWEQVVSRLVLHGLDAKQIGSVHFYQKALRPLCGPFPNFQNDPASQLPSSGDSSITLAVFHRHHRHASSLRNAGGDHERLAQRTRPAQWR